MFGFEVDELGTVVNLVSPFTKEKKVLLYNLQILEHVVTHLTQHPSAKLTPACSQNLSHEFVARLGTNEELSSLLSSLP
jgi:hypothetical protein